MCDSDQTFAAAIRFGEIFRVATEKTITRSGYFQAMSHAFDNTCLQPPCFPLGRNLDGAFAQVYLLSDSRAWIGHVPLAVHHDSGAPANYDTNHVEAFSQVRLADLLMLCIGGISLPTPISRRNGLRCLGEQLIAIGELPLRAFVSYARTQYIRHRCTL